MEVLSSSVAAHIPWLLCWTVHCRLSTIVDSTLDRVIQSCLRMVLHLCTWFLWDLWSWLCFFQGFCLSLSSPRTSLTQLSLLQTPAQGLSVTFPPCNIKILPTWILKTELFLPVSHTSFLADHLLTANIFSMQQKGSLYQAWSWKMGCEVLVFCDSTSTKTEWWLMMSSISYQGI